MFDFRIYESGQIYGLIYTFPERGDGIGMHDHHNVEDRHNIIVLKGSLEVYGLNREWTRTLHTGDIMELEDCHHPHEVLALEPNSEMMGLFVNGRPSYADELSEEEKAGRNTRKVVTHPMP